MRRGEAGQGDARPRRTAYLAGRASGSSTVA